MYKRQRFRRNIGKYAGKRFTVEGEPFTGNDTEWESYLQEMLPTEEDEEKLVNEYMKQEWIQYREWKGS